VELIGPSPAGTTVWAGEKEQEIKEMTKGVKNLRDDIFFVWFSF
jgi:hypothetical protein